MTKIVLGTAQFGMDYGINNKRGRMPEAEAFSILKRAIELEIDTVDTAYAYGISEEVLGSFIKYSRSRLKIISKLPECKLTDINRTFESSLNNLNASSIYGYLIHDFRSYREDPLIWNKLEALKKEGRIEKIGFSLYLPSELELILSKNIKFDIVQLPFNIFDQRFKPYFTELRNRKVEIYVRSIFLQGLFFKDAVELDNYFISIKNRIERLNLLSRESGIPLVALCLNFILRNELIDKIVVGVDNLLQFNEIMQTSHVSCEFDAIIHELSEFKVDDEKIILPFNWGISKVMSE